MANKKQHVIIRTQNAGAFAGYLEFYKGGEAKLSNARRLWYWAGAASLSGLATHGSSKPNECKFPAPVTVLLPQVIEVIETTEAARKSIEAVPEWKA